MSTYASENPDITFEEGPEPTPTLPGDDGKDRFGFTEDERKEWVQKIIHYVEQQEQDNAEERRRWIKWRAQADADPGPKSGNSALSNPSNTMPPLTQSISQSVAAMVENFFMVEPFFPVKALRKTNEQDVTHAATLTNYLDILCKSPADLNIAQVRRIIAKESSLMGRAPVKVPFSKQSWTYPEIDPATGAKENVEVIVHLGPEIVTIEQEDIYYPPEWNDIHRMPWIAQAIHLPAHVLAQRAKEGIYDPDVVEEMLEAEGRRTLTDAEEAAQRAQGIDSAASGDVYDIIECYFYCDADGDGVYEDHVWTVARDKRLLLRQDYNTFGQRPFEFLFHIEYAHKKAGRGVGKTCERLQDEAKGWRDLRADNAKISAMRMFAMPRDVMVNSGDKLYPGKIFVTDRPGDVQPIQAGEVYSSSLQAEERVWNDAAQASILSEVQRGFSDPVLGTRDTYRGQAMRSANAKGVSATILNGMTLSFNRIGMLVLHQLVMNKDVVIQRETELQRLAPEEIQSLSEALDVAPKDLPARFAFEVRTVDLTQTEAAKLQANMQLSQTYAMWAQQSLPLAMQLLSPQGQAMKQQAPDLYMYTLSIIVGATKILQEQMRLSGFEHIGDYLPDLEKYDLELKVYEGIQKELVGAAHAQLTGGPAGPGLEHGGPATGSPTAPPGANFAGPGEGGPLSLSAQPSAPMASPSGGASGGGGGYGGPLP